MCTCDVTKELRRLLLETTRKTPARELHGAMVLCSNGFESSGKGRGSREGLHSAPRTADPQETIPYQQVDFGAASRGSWRATADRWGEDPIAGRPELAYMLHDIT